MIKKGGISKSQVEDDDDDIDDTAAAAASDDDDEDEDSSGDDDAGGAVAEADDDDDEDESDDDDDGDQESAPSAKAKVDDDDDEEVVAPTKSKLKKPTIVNDDDDDDVPSPKAAISDDDDDEDVAPPKKAVPVTEISKKSSVSASNMGIDNQPILVSLDNAVPGINLDRLDQDSLRRNIAALGGNYEDAEAEGVLRKKLKTLMVDPKTVKILNPRALSFDLVKQIPDCFGCFIDPLDSWCQKCTDSPSCSVKFEQNIKGGFTLLRRAHVEAATKELAERIEAPVPKKLVPAKKAVVDEDEDSEAAPMLTSKKQLNKAPIVESDDDEEMVAAPPPAPKKKTLVAAPAPEASDDDDEEMKPKKVKVVDLSEAKKEKEKKVVAAAPAPAPKPAATTPTFKRGPGRPPKVKTIALEDGKEIGLDTRIRVAVDEPTVSKKDDLFEIMTMMITRQPTTVEELTLLYLEKFHPQKGNDPSKYAGMLVEAKVVMDEFRNKQRIIKIQKPKSE